MATIRVVWEDFGQKSLSRVYAVNVMPKRTRVDINSYVEADTFEIELDYKVFPFDPRCVKSAQVTVYMENLDQLHHDNPLGAITPSADNVVFDGFADEDQISMDEGNRTVKLKGRDFTALYIDAKWPGALLPLNEPVDKIVTRIIGRLKASGDIRVVNRTGLKELPTLAKFYSDFNDLSGQRSAQKKETYWDVIQDVCTRAGLIAYIEIDKLVLAKPRTLYDPKKAVQFVYGGNIKSFEMTRKFGKQKGFNVVVRSVIGKEVIKAEIPKESTYLPERGDYVRVPRQGPGGLVIDQGQEAIAPTLSFVVSNVKDKAHLVGVGEKIYEEIGRQQIEGRIRTSNMDAPAHENTECFNLLKLRNATPITLVISTDDLAEITKEASFAKRQMYLMKRGFDSQVATVFAQTLGKFQTPFYTKAVSFSLDAEQGFSVELDFINFIETAGKGLGII